MRTLYEKCPLCLSKDFRPLRSGNCGSNPLYVPALPARIQWVRCGACEHVFTDGFWNQEACEIIFGGTKDMHEVGSDLDRTFPIAARMVEKVEAHAFHTEPKLRGLWIDIGFGNGALLMAAREYGFHACGVDVRQCNVDGLREIDIEGRLADICSVPGVSNLEAEFARRAHVVSLTEVIEHLPYPHFSLQAINRLLVNTGVLLISTPNMGGALWQQWERSRSNPFWDEMEHYHIFSKDRLCSALEDSGFEIARYGISERYSGCMEIVATKTGELW